jgi:LacI family transcriptional regulator
MGRFLCGAERKGKVALIAGSLALRDHAERQFGFNQVLAREYPQISVLPALEGRDDSERTRALTRELLRAHPDIVGVYNVGAGNRGIGAALEESGRAQDILWIAHELTPHTRRYLIRGVIDAIINQDPGHEARSAARVLLAHCSGEQLMADQERIRIDIFVRDNLP